MSAATEVVGIVAEYNPLHQGHVAQIKAVRKAFGDAPIVIALTGAFVQRGEPAVADPWTRARWALHAGADLVVELPAIFALRSAEHFAAGGVRLLHAVGVTTLVCGAEKAGRRSKSDCVTDGVGAGIKLPRRDGSGICRHRSGHRAALTNTE